jgi:nitrogen-specific signal transduction histidine kinase/ActR/RegA family two-component response regulator
MSVHEIQYGGRSAQLAAVMDIGGRKRLEDLLRQSQKMGAIGMLAGGVAHDFNNLLTIITGYTQLILNGLPETDPNRHSAEQILKAGERAAELTQQLLVFSRRQTLQAKVLDLNQMVTSLGSMLRRLIGEDVELHLSLGSELGRVSADPGQIEQVLLNLAVNSRDAMPAGGILTIETANVDLGADYIARHIAVKPGRYVMLAVGDTGVGMDERTRAHAFEPFFTTKEAGRGTGLGLATVFGIVKQSGGSVDVYSEVNQGTTIRIYMPSIDRAVPMESIEAKARPRRGSETIVLAEDEDMVRSLVKETLEREGYRVLAASNAAEAQRLVEESRRPIQLLITDVVMPKMSGRELAQRVSALHPDIRVLYMSGYTDAAVVGSGILQKDVAFLQKPFTPAALSHKVREVLEATTGGSLIKRANE